MAQKGKALESSYHAAQTDHNNLWEVYTVVDQDQWPNDYLGKSRDFLLSTLTFQSVLLGSQAWCFKTEVAEELFENQELNKLLVLFGVVLPWNSQIYSWYKKKKIYRPSQNFRFF